MSEFKGVIVPVITPLSDKDEIDFAALRDHIDALLAAGVHGIVANGSTGEALSLDAAEVRAVVKATIDHVNGRVPVIVGCSANATRDAIGLVETAQELGADGTMITHPYYSHPDPDELFCHYRAISEKLDRPLIIYNNPHVSGIDASPEVLIRISRLPHIDHVKESSGDAARVTRIRALGGEHPRVLCGSDNLALESFSAGAVGWVAACANVIPAECVRLYELVVEQKDLDEAQVLYRRIYPLFDLAESTGKFVQISKAGVELAGIHAGRPRAPLEPLAPDLLNTLKGVLAAIGTSHPVALDA